MLPIPLILGLFYPDLSISTIFSIRLLLGTMGEICTHWRVVVHSRAVRHLSTCIRDKLLDQQQLKLLGWTVDTENHNILMCPCIHLAFSFFLKGLVDKIVKSTSSWVGRNVWVFSFVPEKPIESTIAVQDLLLLVFIFYFIYLGSFQTVLLIRIHINRNPHVFQVSVPYPYLRFGYGSEFEQICKISSIKIFLFC